MKKQFTFLFMAIVLVGSVTTLFVVERNKEQRKEILERAEEAEGRRLQEFKMLRDPKTNKIPENILVDEQKFAENLPKRKEFILNKGVLLKNAMALTWNERGPNNVGGRVRAFGIDAANANTLIAGGISGGIWKSTDVGATWSMKTTNAQLHSVSCLIQDTRSGKTSTWYAGSGEGVGNSADGGGGASYRGDGIFKSTDNGNTWSVLAATANANTPHITNNFDYVWNIAIDPNNMTDTVVFAATTSGIWKSTNGGTTWNGVLGNTATLPQYADVKVAPNGTVYAAGNSGSSLAGIYRSTDAGGTWSNITPGTFPANYARLVLEISSNSNSLFVFGNTPSAGKDGDGGKADQYVSLWNYNVGTTTWTNRSANLPGFVDPVAGLNPQGSYNMMMRLKPGSESELVIGATNLYISKNGFTDSTLTNWVGGYATVNDISQFTNHHSDQHAGAFGSGYVYYSCNDGGVQKTADISAANVTWTSLDNGLNITQCYSVAIEPVASSNYIFAGFQDNACWYGNTSGASAWSNAGSGDGAIVEVGNTAENNTIFSTSQNGGLDRYNKTGGYLATMKPSSAAHQAFTNPLALDPSNSSLLYYGGGTDRNTTGIWRNNDALNGTATTGWSYITNTDAGSTTALVSAIGISTAGNANVVYYGTDEGHVRKIVGANGSSPTVTDIKGTLPNGYVSGIDIDPTNSNKAAVVFSNYGIQSIWYTSDGGTSWTDVEGNLAGAASPSVRSVKMFYISNVLHVFIGTSVGLYYTINLNGSSTVWTQEGVTSVGNVVVPALDFRSSDNTLAAGTHGRGVFTSTFSGPLSVELIEFTGLYQLNVVNLNWSTSIENNNYGFEIERKTTSVSPSLQGGDEKGGWIKIGFVEGKGLSNAEHTYTYSDKNVAREKYVYRLKQIDRNGGFTYSPEIIVDIRQLPTSYALDQNYPNPFNPATTIRYQLLESSNVSVEIFDVAGRLVTKLVDGVQNAGVQVVQWNASRLSSGIYFYRLTVRDALKNTVKFLQTKKMLLTK